MSRVLLLILFLLWLSWTPAGPGPARGVLGLETVVFLGVYLLLVAGLGLWGRMLARRVAGNNLHRSVRRFNRIMGIARMAVPAWFAFGLFGLSWGYAVRYAMGPANRWPVELPGLILATLPAVGAWMGLWWSQFPADRALREQSLLIQLDDNLPIHSPPGFWSYFGANLRLQILFTLVPVLLILLARDVVALVLSMSGVAPNSAPGIEGAVMFAATVGVFLLAPEILRRVLQTQPLPASDLRNRLEQLCRRYGLRYRDILLWRTQHNMGNAAVMGMIPRLRYILLSDLLLETMTDQQIEAVFAHELGHIVHRHMLWYVVFFLILMLAAAGPGTVVETMLQPIEWPAWLPPELLMMLLGVGTFLLIFGFLSRRFERQADVFAARTIQANHPTEEAPGDPRPPRSHVGEHGAMVFSSALARVASINNIPVRARSWCHGSIAKRMQYVRQLSTDPAHTDRFDKFMLRLYGAMLLTLALGIAIAVILYQRGLLGPLI